MAAAARSSSPATSPDHEPAPRVVETSEDAPRNAYLSAWRPSGPATANRYVELVVAHETAGRSDLGPRLLRVRLQGIEIEVEEGTDVDYVGALLEVAARC